MSTSPEQFAQLLSQLLTQQLGPVLGKFVAQQVHQAPPKSYTVNRTNPENGQRFQEITTLPQIMAELCDELKTRNIQEKDVGNELSILNKHIKKLMKDRQ